jgi:FkbM family methyltransferase
MHLQVNILDLTSSFEDLNYNSDYLKTKSKVLGLDATEDIVRATQEVEVSTLDEQIKILNLEKIEVLKIDVEGHELKVIAGMKDCEILPKAFVIEFGHVGFVELNKCVINLGYKLIEKDSVNAFYEKS